MYSRPAKASKGGESDSKNRVERPMPQEPRVGRVLGCQRFVKELGQVCWSFNRLE